ncbi:transcription initiation factor TFIID subunit 3-like [Armigeres subalbatus]|uniref:transcription initiation factor TFIID subunit 3-like n=1 Tax=Armigeres subalbatus TaxID=124917 RepID=UPI002ED2A5E2
MSERYTHQLLKVVVAQICQTIGWHSIQSTPMELMIDILDQYLRDVTRTTHRYTELYNRTDPNLDDVALAYREMGMSLTELQEYLQYVDPIERPFEVPKYPLPKESHLNFMKPGSKETLTRPVHIPEHMPPMLVDSEEEQEEEERRRQMQLHLMAEADEEVVEEVKPDIGEVVEKMEEVGAEEVAIMDASQSEEVVTFKRPLDGPVADAGLDVKKSKSLSDERRPTREISSVIMTTSGFISPAREGRLPDSKPPVIPEEKPKPPPPPPPAPVSTVLPVAKIDEKFGKKAKKKPVEKEKKEKKEKKVDKKKESIDKEKDSKSRPATPTIHPMAEQIDIPSLSTPTSTIAEDIKPLFVPDELMSTPKPPTPVPDIKPSLPVPPELQKSPIPPPVVPITPMTKPKKEKAPRKKKQQEPKLKTPLPRMIPNQGLDVGALFPPLSQTMPPHPIHSPLVNQITPPKPPKPKRTKLTKKQIERQYMEQLQQFQGGPLNAQNILEMLTPPGKKPLPGLFQSPLFPPPQKQTPLHQQPKFPDNVAQSQLDLLQKLHPSLEITPAPGPPLSGPLMHASPEKHKLNIFKKVAKKEPPPTPTTQGPIIVIDDDKSPPHQPQFPMTPMGKKRAPKMPSSGFSFQDALSSPDMGFGMNMSDHSGGMGPSGSFREFSPPKTPSNLPKTPDIKMPSSSSSSASWMSDSGKLSAGPSPMFGDFPNFGLPPIKEEKKKKPRQPKQPKETAAAKKAKNAGLLEELKLLQQIHQQYPPAPPGPPTIDKKPLQDAISNYSKMLNNAMQPGFLASQMRNPGMFGMFPLPSGPGLIPDNPLFNPFNPGQSFLPPAPFGMPLPPRFDINKLLQNPRPTKASPMENFDNLDPETKLAHTPLDLQKSTCNVAPLVPPSLQIDPATPPTGGNFRKKPTMSPVVKEHLPQEQSLNLSIKPNVMHQNHTIPSSVVSQPPIAHQQPKFSQAPTYPKDLPIPATIATTATTIAPSHHPPAPSPAPVVPQNIPTLAAASPTVPPITPGETIVIETDSDTNSQSTVTMAAMGISPPQSSGAASSRAPVPGDGSAPILASKDKSEKRKNKEHKKDRKVKEGKEGKIKKKKDKKDKNKSKDRDRERPKSSHSMNQDLSDGPMETSFSAIGGAPPMDDPMQLEQIRRKEKKEKKKEKLKKEKRKEKERAAAAALESSFPDQRTTFPLSGSNVGDLTTPGGPSTSYMGSSEHRNSPDVTSAASVPKLMLKLGSTNTPSPRSNTPDNHPPPPAEPITKSAEIKREASPELARISALVTRPPKLKTPGSKGKSKESDEPSKAPKLSADHSSKAAGKLDFSATDQPAKPRPRGIQALPDSIDLFSVTPTPPTLPKPAPAVGSAPSSSSSSSDHPKKPSKEPKSSKSASASASLGVTIPAPLNTPINVQDADGNVVWICPACGRVDDGTPMIGCDGCDAWYHWVCVGIQVPPDSNEDWYCRVCIGKKQESHGDEKQKKRKKKDKKNPKD